MAAKVINCGGLAQLVIDALTKRNLRPNYI